MKGIIIGLTIGLWALVIAATYLLGKPWGFTATEMVGLGQTIIELLLIPIVVVGFWQARQALEEAAAKPKLRSAFLGEDGQLHDEYTVSIPSGGGEANRVTFALENTGKAIAVWWQVSLFLPIAMLDELNAGESQAGVWERHVKKDAIDTMGDVKRFTFQSKGEHAAFPGSSPVEVASLRMLTAPGLSVGEQYAVRYEILTDKTDPVTGELPIRFEGSS